MIERFSVSVPECRENLPFVRHNYLYNLESKEYLILTTQICFKFDTERLFLGTNFVFANICAPRLLKGSFSISCPFLCAYDSI